MAPKVVEVARDIDLGSPDLRLPRTPKDPDSLVALSDTWGLGGSVTRLVETLTDLGIPAAEAHAYAEGIRRGGALVIVKPSDEWTERGIEIMNRRQAVDIDERIPHWRQEGWTGMATRAGSSPAAAAPEANVRPEARPEQPRTGSRVGDEEVTIPVVAEELAVGKREGRPGTPVTVVSHSRMALWRDSLQAAGMFADALYAETAALPITPNGVTLVIDSDAHWPRTLPNMRFGVATARRAWLTAAQVANTRPWTELDKLRKRSR